MSELEAAVALTPRQSPGTRGMGRDGGGAFRTRRDNTCWCCGGDGLVLGPWEASPQVIACGRTLRFYPSVYSPKRSALFKFLPRAVRPFHARPGTSLPSHSSSLKASAATGTKSCNIELCSVHAGKFPNVRKMPSNFSCLVGRPREGETLKGGESGPP